MNMANPIRDDDERERPLDPALEDVRRRIVRFVAINLVFLLLALMAVAGAIVYKWRGSAPSAAAVATGLALPVEGQTIQGSIGLPAGARIVSQSLSGDRLSMQVEEAGRQAIYIYDLAAGRMVARFAIEEGK